MTVTKGKRNYSFPVNSAQSSDVESLHLGSASASDTESINNEPTRAARPFVPPVFKSTKLEEQIIPRKNSGRKKLRRYQNRYLLQTLAEEEEDEGTFIVIMEPYKSPFSKLLEDKDALEFWNTFIDKSEEEQAEVVNAFSQRNHIDSKNQIKEKPFARISSKIKRTIKVKRNLSLEQVKKSEDDLIEFFKKTPDQIYMKCTPTYFERLLMHAIAQYHGLQSLGMVQDGHKRVEVYNIITNWVPAECFLTDFVAQLRK